MEIVDPDSTDQAGFIVHPVAAGPAAGAATTENNVGTAAAEAKEEDISSSSDTPHTSYSILGNRFTQYYSNVLYLNVILLKKMITQLKYYYLIPINL